MEENNENDNISSYRNENDNVSSYRNENNISSYRMVNYSGKESKSSGGGKRILVPFISGVLGASLVIGVCFGVPDIRKQLLNANTLTTSTSVPTVSTSNAVSLTTASDVGSYAANKILPSIVGITVEYSITSIFGSGGMAQASGSGIIISEDGYIITNNHVVNTSVTNTNAFYQVSDATKLTVKLYNDDAEYDAKVIGTDALTDIAVIKIEKNGLTPAEMGNSDELQLGEFAMVAGNPVGLDFSVTTGSISAINREVRDSDGNRYTVIQTDAAINSGNSGGALINSKGQVVGISFMKYASAEIEGICFAIPITPNLDVINQLITNQRVIRPYIGIGGQSIDASTAKRYGIAEGYYITSIDPLSNAAIAGIQVKDVITAIDDKPIKSRNDIDDYKYSKEIGDVVTITVDRNGEKLKFEVELMPTPAD